MNSFGNKFRLSIFGESHGPAIGIVIDGVPAGIPLDEKDFIEDILRRKPGKKGTTTREEKDTPRFLSGVFNGYTTGSPLTMTFENENVDSSAYDDSGIQPRPGHADLVNSIKFEDYNDYRGGGHSSGRLTLPLVAAARVAKSILYQGCEHLEEEDLISVRAYLTPESEAFVKEHLDDAISKGDSLGAVIECRVRGLDAGIGEPFFESLESQIAQLAFSIPGVRGVEFGDGFASSYMRGSQHNDPIIDATGKTSKNGAGGINGGLSNGNDIVFRVAFKPTSSIMAEQKTYNFSTGESDELSTQGRHDACFALRCPVIVEAIVYIVLAQYFVD